MATRKKASNETETSNKAEASKAAAKATPKKASKGSRGKPAEKSAAEAFVSQYDLTSTQRYVDSTSRRTELEKTLEELKSIAADKLSWDILGMTQKHFGDSERDNAHKLEVFLGTIILHAATELFEKGQEDAAFRQLEQARKVLETRKKLLLETEALRARTEDAVIDITDLF